MARIAIISLVLFSMIISACAHETSDPETIEEQIHAGRIEDVRQAVEQQPGLLHREGIPLLQIAVSRPHARNAEMAEMLIQLGANVNEVYEPEDWTALSIAMNNGNLDCVEVLLRQGASLTRRDQHGMTPIESARYYLSTYTDPDRHAPGEVKDERAYSEQGIAQWTSVIDLLEQEQRRRDSLPELE